MSCLSGGGATSPPVTAALTASASREIAWAVSTELTRGVTRDAARAAAPAKTGRRAGQPVRSRDLSLASARRLILAAIRAGHAGYQALTTQIARHRVTAVAGVPWR